MVNKNGYLQIHCCLSIFIENFNACLQLLNAQVANLARERFVWNHFFPFRSTLLKHCSNAAALFHLVGMSDAISQMERDDGDILSNTFDDAGYSGNAFVD